MPQIGVGDRVDVEFMVGGSPIIRRQGVVLAVERSFVDVAAPFMGSAAPLRVKMIDLAAAGARHWRTRQDFFPHA